MNSGGPAFPCDYIDTQPCTGDQVVREQFYGLTKRDYFAAKAMQELICNEDLRYYFEDTNQAKTTIERAVVVSYKIADAMIAESERET